MVQVIEKESTKKEPKWRPLYEAIKDAQIDTVYPWAYLLNLTNEGLQNTRNIIVRVNKELLLNDKKMLISVFNKGYKIAIPREQIGHVEERKQRGIRQFRAGVDEAINLNLDFTSLEERVRATHYVNYLQGILKKAEGKGYFALKKSKESIKAQEELVGQIESAVRQLEELKNKIDKLD